MSGKPSGTRSFFPKRGYVLLLAGMLAGFLVFAAIAAIYNRPIQTSNGGGVPDSIEFEFLYTSEKQAWIEQVTPIFEQQFEQKYGIKVHVVLTVTGTHDTVNRLVDGSAKPTAWSPASSIWIPLLNRKIGAQLADLWVPLVLSPTVIAGWSSLIESHKIGGFVDLYDLAFSGVDFKFGHPDPLLSNGGTTVVLLEFAEAAGKTPDTLTVSDLTNETVIEIVRTIESKAVQYGKSTGFFGSWAVENGPSAISFFGVYENVVLDNAERASARWNDPLRAVYPQFGTVMNDHPYVVLNAEWVSEWQRFAANEYGLYLLSEGPQSLAQEHGFRPANPAVPLDQSIFRAENGVVLELDIPILKAPSGEVLEALFTVWSRVRNPGV
jgi:hypothetical protein